MNISKTLIILALVISFASCKKNTKKGESVSDSISTDSIYIPALEFKWKTDSVLTTCESVVYDSKRDILYVSNIIGDPSIKDGQGSISKLDMSGKIIEKDWITGLNAPKGMGIVEGSLFVADIDEVVEIGIEEGKVISRIPVEGAQFLNDITVKDNQVFVSDSNVGLIALIMDGSAEIWLDSLDGPNGLLAVGDQLLQVSFSNGSFNSIDLNTKEKETFDVTINGGDGIAAVGDGSYLISNWNGEVYFLYVTGGLTKILDTKAKGINAADIEYVPSANLLLVPNFFANTVSAYELIKVTEIRLKDPVSQPRLIVPEE